MGDLPARRNPGSIRYPLRDVAVRIDILRCGCMHTYDCVQRTTETDPCDEHRFDADEWERRLAL
jgi:hypothetical protein